MAKEFKADTNNYFKNRYLTSGLGHTGNLKRPEAKALELKYYTYITDKYLIDGFTFHLHPITVHLSLLQQPTVS